VSSEIYGGGHAGNIASEVLLEKSMSLPSLTRLTAEARCHLDQLSEEQLGRFMLGAIRSDLPLACEFLHKLSHGDGTISPQDPNSLLGKQLIRICGGDVLRSLAEEHLCHGKKITFYNCCGIAVREEKPTRLEMLRTQFACQVGPIAYADC
jgi:hypothetical protein